MTQQTLMIYNLYVIYNQLVMGVISPFAIVSRAIFPQGAPVIYGYYCRGL